jgi:hypothetical protein
MTLTVRQILLESDGKFPAARRSILDATNNGRRRCSVTEIKAIAFDAADDAGFEPTGDVVALLLVDTIPVTVCRRCLGIPSVPGLYPGPHGDPICSKCFSMEMHPIIAPDCPNKRCHPLDHPLPKSLQDAVFGRLAEWLIPQVPYFEHPERSDG